MCTYHTGDNHSGPCVLGAGGVVRTCPNLAISVLVVCTYGAIMSQPMTYWRALLLSKVRTYFDHDGVISHPTGAETSCNRAKHHSPMTPMPSADGWEGGGERNSIPVLHKCAPPHEVRSECPVETDRVQGHAVPHDITC